jgi:hypothetical protein
VDFNFIWDGNSLGILAGLIGGFQEYCCKTAQLTPEQSERDVILRDGDDLVLVVWFILQREISFCCWQETNYDTLR